MREIIFFVCLLTVFSASAQSSTNVVRFLQEGKEAELDGDRVLLKRAAFQIEIEGEVGKGVLVGVTFDDAIYYGALGVSDKENVGWYDNTGMAEELFNDSKSVMVSDEAPSYWFFKSGGEHRFDRNPEIREGRYLGVRTINNLIFLNPYEFTSIESVAHDLYIVFYQVDYKEAFQERTIRDVSGYQIVWQD